jgi:hypothetical protein
MSLIMLTQVHVVLSLIAIAAGCVVMVEMLNARAFNGMTTIFLVLTILTSATGFLFPVTQLLPSHVIGALSLLLLVLACVAFYAMKLSGPWRWIYVLAASGALYLNVFVLIVQSFLKIPTLQALAPGNPPSGPVFAAVQGLVLAIFVVAIVFAWRRFKPSVGLR